MVFFSLVRNTTSGRRARRGRPQNPSTIAGRFLEQRAQSEAVRERELHGRRLDAVGHEVESWKRQAEAQVLIVNSVSEELEFKKKKLASESASAKWMEEAAKNKTKSDRVVAKLQEETAQLRQKQAASELAKAQWAEKLAKKQYQLFIQSHPELDSE